MTRRAQRLSRGDVYVTLASTRGKSFWARQRAETNERTPTRFLESLRRNLLFLILKIRLFEAAAQLKCPRRVETRTIADFAEARN